MEHKSAIDSKDVFEPEEFIALCKKFNIDICPKQKGIKKLVITLAVGNAIEVEQTYFPYAKEKQQ